MVNLPKVTRQVDILLDLMGLAVGAMLLVMGKSSSGRRLAAGGYDLLSKWSSQSAHWRIHATSSFSRADVLWASRQGGVHLLDGHQLQRWAGGASLDELGLPGWRSSAS